MLRRPLPLLLALACCGTLAAQVAPAPGSDTVIDPGGTTAPAPDSGTVVDPGGVAAPAPVQPAPVPVVASELSEVDEDFAYQGEFLGSGYPAPTSRLGLQVFTLGNGSFQGRLLPGGLPGDGWEGSQQIDITGSRDASGVTLSTVDGDVTVTVEPDQAIVSRGGQAMATLPKVVRESPTLGLTPPEYATVIFDGTESPLLEGEELTADGLLQEGTQFTRGWKNYRLHLEFKTPYMPFARGQKRGNSGVYLQSRYEVQVLDSFGLVGEFNDIGSLYRYQKPSVNMALPPLQWQTYDIDFQAPEFDADGNKTRNGFLTVWHNGVKIHDAFEIERKTGAGQKEGPVALPTKLQDHGDPVRFRNVWIIDYDALEKQKSLMVAQTPPVPLETHWATQAHVPPATLAYPVLPRVGVSHVPTLFYGPPPHVFGPDQRDGICGLRCMKYDARTGHYGYCSKRECCLGCLGINCDCDCDLDCKRKDECDDDCCPQSCTTGCDDTCKESACEPGCSR